tara:strand:- start:1824 stop:3602 length:1779 start_codon:yes stop_codon:yes gene_type:complete
MATKYDLPQFRTPTQQYRRMPIIRTPNYGEIYAKSFLAGQQMGQATFAPIIAALEKKAKEKKAIEKTVDTFDAQLDISIERAFEGTGNADQKSRELFSKKADMLAEAKKQALLNPNKKTEYELAFKTFKDDLRNWGATSEKLKNLTTILEGNTKMELSNFQNNSFILALKDELIENKGQGLNFRLNEELKDEMFFKDAYGQDVVISTEFLANTDLASLLETKADFSAKGAEGQLFQTLAEEFNTSGIIGAPNAKAQVVNVKKGVTATTAGVVYSESQKDNIKSSLLTDKKFQEIYADGSIAKSKFVHDWILTNNSTETLSIAREKIKAMAKANGVELNEFSDQMIETLLFTYGIDNENMTEDEQGLMDSIDGYIDNQIADYFYKGFYAPNEKQEQTAIKVEPVEDKEDNPIKTGSSNTLALLTNLDTNGGVIDQIAKFHSLVEGMGSFQNAEGEIIEGGRGRLNEYIVEQFGFDLPPEARFDQIGVESEEGLYEEYQYYINDLMVSSKDDYYENAYKFFKFKGSDLTRNQVKTLLELHAAKTALPQIGLRNKYNEYRDKILNNAKNKYTNAGGNVDELFADFEKRRLENFRD